MTSPPGCPLPAHLADPGPPAGVIGGAGSLALAVDALLEGVHFPSDTDARDVGHKSLAVNLSDLAAMGARPIGAWASVMAPGRRAGWHRRFREGLLSLAQRHRVHVVAWDLEQPHPDPGETAPDGSEATPHASPGIAALRITVGVHGTLDHPPITRAGARPGDGVYVTGTLGDAGLALEARRGTLSLRAAARDFAELRLARPQPRVEVGSALAGLASAAIDVSDGLVSDLGHVLAASGVGATLHAGTLPLSDALRGSLGAEQAWRLALGAGDDYELLFTAPASGETRVRDVARCLGVACTRIGVVEKAPGLRVRDPDGRPLDWIGDCAGYRHF